MSRADERVALVCRCRLNEETRWPNIVDALEAAQLKPCGKFCVGDHVIVAYVGKRIRVMSLDAARQWVHHQQAETESDTTK